MISYDGTWYDGTTLLEILHGTNTVVWDMGYIGGMGYGKTPFVVRYVLTVWYGNNTVYGMLRSRYGTMVRCLSWMYYG